MESVKLNRGNLLRVSKQVKIPAYSQSDLFPSIVHIGLGHFHRSHQAVYLDDLLNRGLSKDGIFEMNLIPDTLPLAEILSEQDYLYTLITKNPNAVDEVRVVGSVTGYMNAANDKDSGVRRAAGENVKLITFTVTEGGYFYDKKTKEPNLSEAVVKWDIEHRDDPKTAPAFLAAVLAQRFRESKKPLTVASCDNVAANGKIMESCVRFFCREHYPEILSWLDDNVSFPSSMVDRITPGTTPALIKELEENYGVVDRWPVCGEDFRQWVLEDNFKTAVPDYAAAGVQIVKDVEPYEYMKQRLLNGSHQALAYTGYLMGYTYVDEVMADPLMRNFIRNHYMEQVTPTLEPVPGIDLASYKDTLVRRFSNPNIRDTILRLCYQASDRIPTFVMNPLYNAVKRGLPVSMLCFVLASWARFLCGKDDTGRDILIDDTAAPVLRPAAENARSDPAGFLRAMGVQQLSEAQSAGVAAEVKRHLDRICEKGAKAALAEALGA